MPKWQHENYTVVCLILNNELHIKKNQPAFVQSLNKWIVHITEIIYNISIESVYLAKLEH